MVIGYILQRGGLKADAEEIALDTLVYFDRNIRNGRFKEDSTLKTYFFSIAKLQWFKFSKRKKTLDELNLQHHDQLESSIENYMITKDKVRFLKSILGHFGEKCKQLFMLKQRGYSNEDMARELNYTNADMAKKALYRCRKKFRENLGDIPGWKMLYS